MIFLSYQPIRLFVHNDRTERRSETMFTVSRNESVFSTFNLNYISLLPRDLGNGKTSCSNTSYFECLDTAAKNLSDKMGCRTPWTMNFELLICDNETTPLNESYESYENTILNEDKLCPDMCRSLETNLFKYNRVDRSDGRALFGIYPPRTITVSEEHYLYTSLNLFAEIGCYMGLLMGYSFLNVAYFFGQFMDMKIRNLEIASGQRRKKYY